MIPERYRLPHRGLVALAGLAAIVLALLAIFQSPASDTIDMLGWAAFSGGVGVTAAALG